MRFIRNGMTRECIAGPQIKHWIGEMYVYQQQQIVIELGFKLLKEINGGLRWVRATYKLYPLRLSDMLGKIFRINPVI